jgi:hypothetical protein
MNNIMPNAYPQTRRTVATGVLTADESLLQSQRTSPPPAGKKGGIGPAASPAHRRRAPRPSPTPQKSGPDPMALRRRS